MRRAKIRIGSRTARTNGTAAGSPGLRTRGQKPPASAGERDQTAFPEGQVGPFTASDDDVVQNLDVEDLTRLHELTSNADVFGGGSRIRRWMVVLCEAHTYVQ